MFKIRNYISNWQSDFAFSQGLYFGETSQL